MRQAKLPDHLKVPWNIKDALVAMAFIWIGFSIAIDLTAMMLSPFSSIINDFYSGLKNDAVWPSFISALLLTVAGFGLIYFYLKKYNVGWASVGWRKFKPFKAIGLILLVLASFLIGISLLLLIISVLIPAFNANQPQTNSFTGPSFSIISLIALVVLPPFIEETLFRGFMFPAFSKKYGVIWGAILSSFIFGFAHLQFNVGIYTFVLGILLCFMYIKLKSIFPGILVHMLNNYIAYIAIAHH